MAFDLPSSPTPPHFHSWQPAIPHRHAIPRYEVALPWQPSAVPSMRSPCVLSIDANLSDGRTGHSANTTASVELASGIAPTTSDLDEDFSVTERNADYSAPDVELIPPPMRPQDKGDALEIVDSHRIDDAPEREVAEPESTDGAIAAADAQTHVTDDLGTSHTETEPSSDKNFDHDLFDTHDAGVLEDVEGSQPAVDRVTADSTSDHQELDSTTASPEAISDTALASEHEVAPEPEVAETGVTATEVTEAETETLDDIETEICDPPDPEEEIGIAQQTQENGYAEHEDINETRSESDSSEPQSPEASSEAPSEDRADRGTDSNSNSAQDAEPHNNSDPEPDRHSTVMSNSASDDEEAKTVAQLSTIVMTIAIIVFWLLLR